MPVNEPLFSVPYVSAAMTALAMSDSTWSFPGALALVQEDRDGDGGEDADDEHDDEGSMSVKPLSSCLYCRAWRRARGQCE